MTLETVPCDLCGQQRFMQVYPSTIADPNADPALYYSSSRQRTGHLRIVRCVQCGLVMTNPRDDAPTLKRVYGQLTDAAYDAEEGNRRRTAQAYLRLIKHYCPQPGPLVDVGCATGVFACEAQRAGWRVTGLEASAWSIARARERCTEVTWLNSLLEEAQLPAASMEVVTLWDVLEHVHSPTAVLRHLRTWLKPGGWLFLNLPNSASLTARLLGPRWVLLLREHLWYFSPETMGQLLQKTGFVLRAVQPNFVRFSWANIATRLGQYPGWLGRAGRALAQRPALRNLSLTFPIGEMQVAAQVAD